ncbi:MAG: tRNA (guanosine(46)-N7)-methyltransferase TrmB [Bacteroidia bacterium]
MGKDKLRRWAELETFERTFQPKMDFPMPDFYLKGKWNSDVFKNENPIVLELGCGRGEYTVHLAKNFPQKNFIGIDIKGARLWRGAKTINEEKILNAAFVRMRIEFIENFFSPHEIGEIWLTFPDPQIKDKREHRRLTHPAFIERYKRMMKPNGILHLKSDSAEFYEYTLQSLAQEQGKFLVKTNDLYNSHIVDEILSIKTTYENIFLKEGKKITYIKFQFGEG